MSTSPYKRYLKPLKSLKLYISFEQAIGVYDWSSIPHLINEAQESFQSRNVKLLSSDNLKRIDKFIAHDVAIRSRLVVIRASLSNSHSLLHDSLLLLRDQLYYENPLDYKCKTQTELKAKYRENVVYWIDYRNMLESWVENLDMFIDGIDKATWSTKNIIQIRDMEVRKEWGVDK